MRARWPVFAVVAALGGLYAGYPYVTLWRLDAAIRRSDAATLRSLVDWYAVREGLKEDICDMAADEPDSASAGNELPAFGASFVRGITGSRLDQTVTPETLVSMTRAGPAAPRETTHVVWAFFHDPTRFDVDVRAGGSAEPIRMVMELRGMRWLVRRVWLPDAMLERARDLIREIGSEPGGVRRRARDLAARRRPPLLPMPWALPVPLLHRLSSRR